MVSLNLDPNLLQEAIDLNDGQPIETDIETALREYIQRRKQLQVIKRFGTIDYADYDYKQQRQQP
jgi:metal-responsive CopG/Arc/MetJ family transcriptional regulator